MKKILTVMFIIPLMFSFFGMFVPQYVLAQNAGGSSTQPAPATQTTNTGTTEATKLDNPIKGVKDIPTLVEKLLRIVLKIGAPLIALTIIYTEYLFIAAQGNHDKIAKAKNSLLFTLIGALILLGAYVIAESVVGTINAIRGN